MTQTMTEVFSEMSKTIRALANVNEKLFNLAVQHVPPEELDDMLGGMRNGSDKEIL